MKVNIYVKKLGRNRPQAVPITYDYPASIRTVKDLLKETVRINLEAYKKGSRDTDIARVLTKEEIENQAESGKIAFGIHYNTNETEFETAVENAWQCFEDGITALFVDGERLENLETPVGLHEESELTFIRMTMLAGRMW
ncbi:hypothetical protein GPL15_17325 [Clostridium sp. MCC353]|uniref:hypothetical protein n=1 Tax=Clostridium sp. MCC353 TaxID=2592646 RepID=UPI001C027A22|nr:hypothetical protein [Clostridium sp. MCC353]MBT9778263.1 hypothetical protein [Clostridium sp. MCC353]